jgi:hypothetical protein
MKRYAPFRFRPVFGMAAVAMTAATMALAVGVPVALAPDAPDSAALAALAATRAAPATEVPIVLPRIDVVGVRDDSVAATPARDTARPRSTRG